MEKGATLYFNPTTPATVDGNYPDDNGLLWLGDSAYLILDGVFGTATITVQLRSPATGDWYDVSGYTTSDGNTIIVGSIPANVFIRINISNASGATSIRATIAPLEGISVPSSSAGGGGSSVITEVTPGTSATNLGKTEDAIHASGDVGVMALAVRNDSASTTLTSANGDYSPVAVDNKGQVFISSATLALESGGNLAAIAASASVLDDWDESDRVKTNPIVGQAGVQGGSGTVSANTQRVALATDVALPAGTNEIGKLAANSGVDIGDVDVTSIIPGTGATNLGKAEDDVHNSGDTGVLLLGVRADSSVEFTDADGDYSPIAITNKGYVYTSAAIASSVPLDIVSVIPGTGATSLGKTEDAIHASGDVGVMALAVRNNAHSTTLTSANGDYSPIAVSGTGEVYTQTEITSVIPGTGATNLAKAEDAAHSSGDTGVAIWGVRNDAKATTFGANGDYTPIATNSAGSVFTETTLIPVASGGLLTHRLISAASTNATSVKASAGQVYGGYISNINTAARYLKLYNKASAPTVGTDTPFMTLLIPGNSAGGGGIFSFPHAIPMGTGIAFAITTGATDADTGAVVSAEVIINLFYL